MRNNSRISIFLSFSLLLLTAINIRDITSQANHLVGIEKTPDVLMARVVHDPEDSKNPPPP
jgi:hypothetical protein